MSSAPQRERSQSFSADKMALLILTGPGKAMRMVLETLRVSYVFGMLLIPETKTTPMKV